MIRMLFATLALAASFGLAACDVTGVAPPQSAYVHQEGMDQIGQPGFGAP